MLADQRIRSVARENGDALAARACAGDGGPSDFSGAVAVDSAMFSSVLGGAEPASFAEATLNGWAPDGGMYWPTAIEPVGPATLAGWASLSYPRLCEEVLKRFIRADDPDISRADLASIVSSAFDAFGSNSVLQLQPLTDGDEEDELHVVELWHGPTLAFKDLGMAILGRVLSHLLRRRGRRLTLLVGTSGDTGSSAIEAVRGLPNLSIFVLYPLQGYASITPVQERQMTAIAEIEANVHVYGVEGSSDDLDVPMEACFADKQFKARHSLGSVNSVNVVRLIVQTVHYFYAYLRAAPPGDTAAVEFAVPCGAAGALRLDEVEQVDRVEDRVLLLPRVAPELIRTDARHRARHERVLDRRVGAALCRR